MEVRTMKRTKQLQNMIDLANEYMKVNHVSNEADPVFHFMSYALLKEKCYEGFNYYTSEGKLSGGVDTDYIQLY
jgi:hypothetical protein